MRFECGLLGTQREEPREGERLAPDAHGLDVDGPTHDRHVGALERPEQLAEPAGLGDHVAVDEDEQVAARPIRTEVLERVVGHAARR